MTDPTTTTEVPPRVVEFLRENMTMTLATATPTGIPRATTLHYVNDDLDLYVWMRSQAWAAQQIEQNPLVSFAINQEGAGLQGSGQARVLACPARRYRVPWSSSATSSRWRWEASTMNISFFRIVPTDVKLVDERYAGGRGETQMFSGAEYSVEQVYNVIEQLPVGELGLISGSLQRVEAEAGSTIARQGAPADKFVIVLDGEVEVVRESDGDAETVATLGPGDFFGEVAILQRGAAYGRPQAASAATLLTMDREQFSSSSASHSGRRSSSASSASASGEVADR